MKALPRIKLKEESINKIKLSTLKVSYVVCDTTITCNLLTKLNYNGELSTPIKISAETKLHEGDKFDFEKGKKIALAKAERAAYKKAYNLVYTIYNENKTLKDDSFAFLYKAKKQIEHNNEYIISLSK